MELDKNTNYIVSGLERSGTSLLMQILKVANIPIGYDQSRPADDSNPKGYYELEGGKIINKLADKSFPLEKYQGQFIKVTSFGLQFLPPRKYKIIYSERNIEEILDSMEKMMDKKDTNREETRDSFTKLHRLTKHLCQDRDDIEVLFVNYNNIMTNPKEDIGRIVRFLGLPEETIDKMASAVDTKLYRQRRPNIPVKLKKKLL
jgi:hypothetical protein